MGRISLMQSCVVKAKRKGRHPALLTRKQRERPLKFDLLISSPLSKWGLCVIRLVLELGIIFLRNQLRGEKSRPYQLIGLFG